MLLHKIKELIKILLISKRNLGATGDSWRNFKIPEEQLKVVDSELEMLRRGVPPSVYTVGAEALNSIPGDNKLTLLEVGSASGYYFEVISKLCEGRFEYIGSDYSDAMIAVAQKRYPNTKFLKLDIGQIELPDKAYDVVFSGAVIVHVKKWEEAVRELARVARSYLILHRTPVTDVRSYRTEKKIYAGVPVFYNSFKKDELMNIISECRFRKIFEKNVYPNEKKGLVHMTYGFERF
jgi:SAM-dependent methyltransferase